MSNAEILARLDALERANAAVYFASVNADGTVTDGNIRPDQISRVGEGEYIIDFSATGHSVDNAIIVAGAVTSEDQPIFINAGNNPAAERTNLEFLVQTWAVPLAATTEEGVFYFPPFPRENANFRVVIVLPQVLRAN